MDKSIRVYIDGASRGNPGHSAIAVVICSDEGAILEQYSEYIGVGTNNQAEYRALLAALKKIQKRAPAAVTVYLDSEILFKQMTGEYRVRDEKLKKLFAEAIKISGSLQKICYEWIPREKNKIADKLSQKAINLKAINLENKI